MRFGQKIKLTNTIKLLIEPCQEIWKSSDIGKNYAEIENDILGFQVGKHIIFYRETRAEEIEILRILHGRTDLKIRIDE